MSRSITFNSLNNISNRGCGDADLREVVGTRFESFPTSRHTVPVMASKRRVGSLRLALFARPECAVSVIKVENIETNYMSIVLYYTNTYTRARLIALFDVVIGVFLFGRVLAARYQWAQALFKNPRDFGHFVRDLLLQ